MQMYVECCYRYKGKFLQITLKNNSVKYIFVLFWTLDLQCSDLNYLLSGPQSGGFNQLAHQQISFARIID